MEKEDEDRKKRTERLAEECAKLDPAAERAAAEETFSGETVWPEYSEGVTSSSER